MVGGGQQQVQRPATAAVVSEGSRSAPSASGGHGTCVLWGSRQASYRHFAGKARGRTRQYSWKCEQPCSRAYSSSTARSLVRLLPSASYRAATGAGGGQAGSKAGRQARGRQSM